MSDKIITTEMKGVALIAIGIVMRDTGCTASEVLSAHSERYKKLIAKKGKNYALDDEERVEVLSGYSIEELVS